MKLYPLKTKFGEEYYTTEQDNFNKVVCKTNGDAFEMMHPKLVKLAGFKSVKLDIFDDWEISLINEAIICKIRANANACLSISNESAIDALNLENENLVNIQKRINEYFKQ